MKKVHWIFVSVFAVTMMSQAQPAPGGRGPFGGGRGGEIFRQLFEGRGGRGGGSIEERMAQGARRMGMTFNEAPTMRMSLFDVVERIGGKRAENILLAQLQVSVRAVEIVHLAGCLERLSGGDKHKDEVLAVAKHVLKEQVDQREAFGYRVDARGLGQVWGLLEKYGDESFVQEAQSLLIDGEGKMDGSANNYLRRVMKENIMTVYQNLYANSDVDDGAKNEMRRRAMDYMGKNSAANAIVQMRFKELATQMAEEQAKAEAAQANGEESPPRRGFGQRNPIQTIGSYMSRLGRKSEDLTSQEISSRKQLLASLRVNFNTPEITVMFDRTSERLDTLADPEKSKDARRDFSAGPPRQRGDAERQANDLRSRIEQLRRNREAGGGQ
tara:strand:- start:2058 stop:3209 length:1152 start_codon:yes stop_codon:yes gene_type:complete